MNNAIKIALASALALGSVSGAAFAQTAAVMTEQTDVSVVRIDSLNNDSGRSEYDRLTKLSDDTSAMTEAQAMVSADPMLVAALESKNVQLNNVVHVETAANGGKIVYVR